MTIDVHRVGAALLELSPYPSLGGYVARGHALLGALVGSAEGNVVLAVRVAPAGDPLGGFRPVHAFTIGPRGTAVPSVVDAMIADDTAMLGDPVMRSKIAGAGRHRVCRERREVCAPFSAQLWRDRGLIDRLQLVYAIDRDRELWVSFDRLRGERRFTAADARALESVVASVGGWARRVAYMSGHAPGTVPLSERERDTLTFLLSDVPQKQLAKHLAVSEARARELVRILYGKLGVAGRLELTWRWFGAAPRGAALPVSITSRPLRRSRRPSRQATARG